MVFPEIISNGAISVYVLQGRIAYDGIVESYRTLDDIGTGVFAMYRLYGISANIGIKKTIDVYGNYLENVTNFELPNIDKNISRYTSNVSGGIDLINDFSKEKINKPLSNLNSFSEVVKIETENNVNSILGGFSYLKEKIFRVPNKGIEKLSGAIRDFSQKFGLNIKENIEIGSTQTKELGSSVLGGVKNTFTLDLLSENKNFTRKNTANAFSSIASPTQELPTDLRCSFLKVLGSECGRDIQKKKIQTALIIENKFIDKVRKELLEAAPDDNEKDAIEKNIINIIENRVIEQVSGGGDFFVIQNQIQNLFKNLNIIKSDITSLQN